MQYIITQEPKAKYRSGLVVKVAVVEAKSKRGALAMIARHIAPDPSFKNPVVEVLCLDHCYRL